MTSPALQKTWDSSIGNATSLAAFEDQVQQFREILYFIKTAFLAAGWTVSQSTSGSAAVTTGDQWTSASVLVVGLAPQDCAFIVLESPAIWNSSPVSYLLAANNTNASATPTNIYSRWAIGGYALGSVGALPAPNDSTMAITAYNIALLTWTTPTYATVSYWVNTGGDVIIGIKPRNDIAMRGAIMARGSGGVTAGGRGANLATVFSAAGASFDYFGDQMFTANWQGWQTSDIRLTSGTAIVASNSFICNWNSTPDAYPGGNLMFPIYAATSTGGTLSRWFGRWTDVYTTTRGGTIGSRWKEVRDGDTSAIRYAQFGDLWLPTVASQLIGVV